MILDVGEAVVVLILRPLQMIWMFVGTKEMSQT